MFSEELQAIFIELAVFTELNRKMRQINIVSIHNTCHQWRRIVLGLPLSIDVEHLSPNSLYWPTYFLSLNHTIRAFSVRWAVLNGANNQALPICAVLKDDPTYQKAQAPGIDIPERSKAKLKSLMSALIEQRERIFQIDLLSENDEMPNWKNLLTGEMGKLQVLRVWLGPWEAPHFLHFTSSSLTTLILQRCIPPSSKSWNLRTLVIYNLSRNDWDYTDVIQFLSTAPFLEHIAFDGDFYIPQDGSTTLARPPPALPNLVSISLTYDFDVAIAHRCRLFKIVCDLSTPNLTQIEWYEGLTGGGVDELDALPQQYLDGVEVIVISPKYLTAKWKRPGIVFCNAWPDIIPIRSPRCLFIDGFRAVEKTLSHIHCFPCVQDVHVSTIDGDEEEFERYSSILSKVPTARRRVILYSCDVTHTYPTNIELRNEAWDVEL